MKKIIVFLSLVLSLSYATYAYNSPSEAPSAVAPVPENAKCEDAISAQDAAGTKVITIQLYSCKLANGKKGFLVMYKNKRYRIYEWKKNYSNPYYIDADDRYYFSSRMLDLALSSGSGMLI